MEPRTKCKGCAHVDEHGICNYLLDTHERRQAPYVKRLNRCDKFEPGKRGIQDIVLDGAGKPARRVDRVSEQRRRLDSVPVSMETMRAVLNKYGITKAELARRCGITTSTINQSLKRGRATRRTVERWAFAIGCREGELED